MKEFLLISCLLLSVGYELSEAAGGSISSGSSDNDVVYSDPEDMKQIYIGHWFTLDCSSLNVSKSSPLQWFKNEKEIKEDDTRFSITQANSSLLVKVAEKSDITNFECRGEDANKNVLKRKIDVFELNIKELPKSTTVQEGDKLSLVCEVSGEPKPVVKWFKDDIDIQLAFNKSENRLSLSSIGEGDKLIEEASLKLEKVNEHDGGTYTCKIYVISGREEPARVSSTLVRVKSIYAALWPFTGIVCEVLVLCLIIFIYEKRRMKNDLDESDTDQDDKKDSQ